MVVRPSDTFHTVVCQLTDKCLYIICQLIDKMEELAYRNNPWWEWRSWKDRDLDLKVFKEMRVKWKPGWLRAISLKPFSLNFIFGPRQVGKTTGIKLLIERLMKETKPKAVFYFNCDLISDARELKSVLDFYREFRAGEGIKGSFIFLDEVTGVENWWKIVKGYIDIGLFQDDVLTVLGSASFKLKRFYEAFPGRRGLGRKIEVMPLDFKEYVKVHGIKPKMSEYDKLLAFFDKYLQTGGFPRSINEDERSFEDLIMSVERDVSKAGRSVKIFRMVLRSIIEKAPSALSYNSIASEIGISHNTVAEYMGLMEDMFILGMAYLKEGGKVLFRKEKKFFLRDPFITKTFANVFGLSVRKGFLYEWVVQEHLLRKFGEVHYWRNGYEVDCIADGLKVEVKAGKPHRRYPKDVLVLSEHDIPRFLLDL